jgi:hypothetical protein
MKDLGEGLMPHPQWGKMTGYGYGMGDNFWSLINSVKLKYFCI